MPLQENVALADALGGLQRQSSASVFHNTSVQYRPAIDGLRAIAVLAVFIFHLNHGWLRGGFVGVDVFFVISGYLITSILLRDFERNSFSLGKFYQRRISRLFPAFFTVAFATIVGAFFIYSAQDLALSAANMTGAILSVANMKFINQGNYFALSPDSQPFLQFWSLSVEEQFYMLFPLTLLFIYWKGGRYKTAILTVLCGVSLIACIELTRTKPIWAFFLLPARAWELMAGAILANCCRQRAVDHWKARIFSFAGLSLIAVSFFVIQDNDAFPGFVAILPVLGTMLFIGPNKGSSGMAERLLSWTPLVLVGRLSYSLYLCHWPVFSLVDYKLYLSSPLVRNLLKVGLSCAATALCFFVVENPCRKFLNRPGRRNVAFGFLAGGILFFVPLGFFIRNKYYIIVELPDVARGGVIFNQGSTKGSIVLMGDSHGSMYSGMARQLAHELGLRLNIICATADPLPHSSGQSPSFWFDSLAIVKRERPNFLLLACNWTGKLTDDNGRLAIAVNELKQHTGCLILMTQPPELPASANREAMRNGSRPPFFEDPPERAARLKANALVRSFSGDNVIVIDIDSYFEAGDGTIRFADTSGREYYHDRGHLSAIGASLVKGDVLKVLTSREPARAIVAPTAF